MQDKRYYLYNIFLRISRYFMHSKHNSELTPGEFGVIWTISQSEGKALYPSNISKRMGIARPSLTPLLRDLESKGFIQRRIDEHDGRKYLVELTDKCREHRAKHMERHKLLFNKLIGDLDQQEIDYLLRILQKIEENLQNENDKHGELFL